MNPKLLIGGVAGAAVVAVGLFFVLKGGGGVGGDAEAKQRADQLMAVSRDSGTEATYKSANAAGGAIVIKDVTFKPKGGKIEAVTIAELRVNAMDWANAKAPAFVDMEYRGVRFVGIDKDPGFKRFADGTGIKEVVLNAKWNYAYDKAKKIVDIKTGDVEAEGVGTFSFTGKFEGIDIEQMQNLQQAGAPDIGRLMGLVGAMRLHGLRVAYKDSGGAEKIWAGAAKEQGKSVAEFKDQALKQIAAMRAALPFKIGQEAAAAAESFIKKPGTIEVVAAPKQPFAVAGFMAIAGRPDPAALDKLKDDLGLTISAR